MSPPDAPATPEGAAEQVSPGRSTEAKATATIVRRRRKTPYEKLLGDPIESDGRRAWLSFNDVLDVQIAMRLIESGEARKILRRGDLTLTRAARLFGVSDAAIGHWLQERRTPSLPKFVELGRVLRQLSLQQMHRDLDREHGRGETP